MESWPAPVVPVLSGSGPLPRIWDSASGGVALASGGPVASMYACGITPYDATHMGHAATYVAWDLLVRAWRDAGLRVLYVQNVTDVDDPLLERAVRDGVDWRDLAAREIGVFREDMAALRVVPPDHYIGAVEALGVIGEFAAELAARGSLYDVEGDTYFSRAADPLFGCVSGLGPAAMVALCAENGGDPGRAGKKDPVDPLVWRGRREGEPWWPSALGEGRPGWHVECAAIAARYLGRVFDVQAGGRDLIFPHHEMSASHARVAVGEAGAAGRAFARRYAHAGLVGLGGEKMSKSRGNLVFVSRLRADGHDPMAVRLAILAHHYRGDWDWSDRVLADAAVRLAAWRAAAAAASPADTAPAADGVPAGGVPGDGGAGARVVAAVRERLADDLDAPGALAVVDAWAAAAAAGQAGQSGPLVRSAVDALLGVAL